jgi:hypothetical protein
MVGAIRFRLLHTWCCTVESTSGYTCLRGGEDISKAWGSLGGLLIATGLRNDAQPISA